MLKSETAGSIQAEERDASEDPIDERSKAEVSIPSRAVLEAAAAASVRAVFLTSMKTPNLTESGASSGDSVHPQPQTDKALLAYAKLRRGIMTSK